MYLNFPVQAMIQESAHYLALWPLLRPFLLGSEPEDLPFAAMNS